jgi:DNA-binding MarR family transcriptional regulator
VAEDHIDRILAEWERERPELDLLPIAVVGRILRAARYLDREVERELARFGLTISEFNALSALRRTGAPYRLSPKHLSSSLLLSSGGLTKLLERLEAPGLIVREPDPDDGRGVLVRLTDAGKALQEEAFAAHRENEAELLAALDENERADLGDLLRNLLATLEAGEGRGRPLVRALGTTEPRR